MEVQVERDRFEPEAGTFVHADGQRVRGADSDEHPRKAISAGFGDERPHERSSDALPTRSGAHCDDIDRAALGLVRNGQQADEAIVVRSSEHVSVA